MARQGESQLAEKNSFDTRNKQERLREILAAKECLLAVLNLMKETKGEWEGVIDSLKGLLHNYLDKSEPLENAYEHFVHDSAGRLFAMADQLEKDLAKVKNPEDPNFLQIKNNWLDKKDEGWSAFQTELALLGTEFENLKGIIKEEIEKIEAGDYDEIFPAEDLVVEESDDEEPEIIFESQKDKPHLTSPQEGEEAIVAPDTSLPPNFEDEETPVAENRPKIEKELIDEEGGPMVQGEFGFESPTCIVSIQISEGGPGSKYGKKNEDSAFAFGRMEDGSATVGVIDGAGGSSDGYLASHLANEKMRKLMLDGASPGEALDAADLYLRKNNPQLDYYACAAIARVDYDRKINLGWWGDSRVMVVNQSGKQKTISNMHNRAAVLYKSEPHLYYTSPVNNQILGYMGRPNRDDGRSEYQEETVDGEIGDQIILGSDGLWDVMSPYEVSELAVKYKGEELQEEIYDLVYERNNSQKEYTLKYGPNDSDKIEMPPRFPEGLYRKGDNITVAVILLKEEDPEGVVPPESLATRKKVITPEEEGPKENPPEHVAGEVVDAEWEPVSGLPSGSIKEIPSLPPKEEPKKHPSDTSHKRFKGTPLPNEAAVPSVSEEYRDATAKAGVEGHPDSSKNVNERRQQVVDGEQKARDEEQERRTSYQREKEKIFDDYYKKYEGQGNKDDLAKKKEGAGEKAKAVASEIIAWLKKEGKEKVVHPIIFSIKTPKDFIEAFVSAIQAELARLALEDGANMTAYYSFAEGDKPGTKKLLLEVTYTFKPLEKNTAGLIKKAGGSAMAPHDGRVSRAPAEGGENWDEQIETAKKAADEAEKAKQPEITKEYLEQLLAEANANWDKHPYWKVDNVKTIYEYIKDKFPWPKRNDEKSTSASKIIKSSLTLFSGLEVISKVPGMLEKTKNWLMILARNLMIDSYPEQFEGLDNEMMTVKLDAIAARLVVSAMDHLIEPDLPTNDDLKDSLISFLQVPDSKGEYKKPPPPAKVRKEKKYFADQNARDAERSILDRLYDEKKRDLAAGTGTVPESVPEEESNPDEGEEDESAPEEPTAPTLRLVGEVPAPEEAIASPEENPDQEKRKSDDGLPDSDEEKPSPPEKKKKEKEKESKNDVEPVAPPVSEEYTSVTTGEEEKAWSAYVKAQRRSGRGKRPRDIEGPLLEEIENIANSPGGELRASKTKGGREFLLAKMLLAKKNGYEVKGEIREEGDSLVVNIKRAKDELGIPDQQ